MNIFVPQSDFQNKTDFENLTESDSDQLCLNYKPKNFWAGCEEEIFDPTDVAVGTNTLVSISEGIGRPCFFLLRERQREELDSLCFQIGDEFSWDAMVDDLEESKLFTGLD